MSSAAASNLWPCRKAIVLAFLLVALMPTAWGQAWQPALSTVSSPSVQDSAWEDFQFDFRRSAQGWVVDEKRFRGIYAAGPSDDPTANELLLGVALDASRRSKPSGKSDEAQEDWSVGEAFALLQGEVAEYHVDLWIPPMPIDEHAPPGVQLFVRDDSPGQRSYYSVWHNIGDELTPGQWNKLAMYPKPGGAVDSPDRRIVAGFNPRRVFIVGIKIALNSQALAGTKVKGTFKIANTVVRRRLAPVSGSGRFVDFDGQAEDLRAWRASREGGKAVAGDASQMQRGPFGPRRPYFFTDPGWKCQAWDDDHIAITTGPAGKKCLAIASDFRVPRDAPDSFPGRKGYVCLMFEPNLVLDREYVEDNDVSMDVWCEPDAGSLAPRYPGPSDLTARICVYSRSIQREPEKAWGFSDEVYIGGPAKARLQFVPQFPNTAADPQLLKEAGDDGASRANAAILYVGLSVYANAAWKGTIHVDNVRLGGRPRAVASRVDGVVAAGPDGFRLGSAPFHVRGINVSFLTQKTANVIDETFAMLAQKGFNVVRAWGFADGLGAGYGNEGYALHPTPYGYDPRSFEQLDLFLALAEKHGLRVILPLVNYWSDNQRQDRFENSYGGVGLYMQWAGVPLEYDTQGWLINRHRFYTDTECRKCYRQYLVFMLNRRNAYTGRLYKDSPGIFAWELTNECRNEGSSTGLGPAEARTRADELNTWVRGMAWWLKHECGAQQMVAVGDEGWLFEEGSRNKDTDGSHGVDWEKNLRVVDVDFGTVHFYPEHWGWPLDRCETWIQAHCRTARAIGKPVLFEEFGLMDFSPRPGETDDEAQRRKHDAYQVWQGYVAARGGTAAEAQADFRQLHPTFRLEAQTLASESDVNAHRRTVYSRWIRQIEETGSGWCMWAVVGRRPDGETCRTPNDCDFFTLRVGVPEEEALLEAAVQASRDAPAAPR